MKYCGLCHHNVRDWAAHQTSAEHLRNLYPIASRKSSRQNARREHQAAARRQLSRSHEDRMWAEQAKRERADRRAEQGPRHFYGAWVPYGVSAWAGGHPGRAVRKLHRKVRHHARRLARAARG